MTEYLLCPTCHACLWTEIDWIGRVYWRHPTAPCVAQPPQWWHECAVCDEETRLDAPYVAGRKLVICSDECRAVHAENLRQRQLARIKKNGAQKRWREKKRGLRLERDDFHIDDGVIDMDGKKRRSA